MSEPALTDPPPATPAPADALADLILARLLTARDSVGVKKIREDLVPFFRLPPPADRVGEVVAALRAAGLVTPGRTQRLTDAGRRRALEYLGAKELPPRANWAAVKAKYLVPKALGLAPGSDEAKAAADPAKLAALLVKRKYGLPDETPLTLGAVLDAIAYRELGLPVPRKPKPQDLRAAVISRKLRTESPLSGKQLADDGPRLLLGSKTRGAAGLRTLVLGAFADRAAGEREDGGDEFDLEAFANTVKSAARRCPTGRFGDNKVFISHVWRELKDEPRFAPLGLGGFKARLVEANRTDLLTLSRADLVQLMDPTAVRESETTYLNAAFHFILVEKE